MWWFIGNIWWFANLFELNLVFGWKSFCKLRNELHVIDFSNVTWKLILMAFGSYMHSLLQISEFSKHLWGIYESLDGVHASFEIFGILFEQWSQFKVQIVKVGKILACLKFGRADGPRVRGGRSAVYEVFHQRLWSAENCSADSPPMDRGRSARCTGKLRLHRWYVHYASADGPPSIPRTVRQVYRGRSAWDKLNLPKKVTNIGLILSHLNWKVLKLKSSLQVVEEPRFGFEMI